MVLLPKKVTIVYVKTMVVIFFVLSFFAKNKKKFCFFCAKTKKKTKNIFILIFQLLHTDFKCNFQFKMESNSKMLWHQIFWLNYILQTR